MDLFKDANFDRHERVVFCHDQSSDLRAVIAIHNTARGPAAGGTRMWNYLDTDQAVIDALRLSRGMSYKNAMASLPFGGGKAVIIGDSHKGKTPEMMMAFGRCVESLHGDYITAEDVGITVEDIQHVATQTKYVTGLPGHGELSGDPSPKTAYGVLIGIRAAVGHKLGRDSLEGVIVSVQGVGGVGYDLCRRLAEAGAKLLVADIDEEKIERSCDEFGATSSPIDRIVFEQADVFAPCALGGILEKDSIPKLNVPIVAGGANNQLATPQDGDTLRERGILFAPDYVINAGGIISVAHEYLHGADRGTIEREIEEIGPRLSYIFKEAERRGQSTNALADQMAEELLYPNPPDETVKLT